MMQVMHLRFPRKEIISAMHSSRNEQLVCHKYPKSKDMALQELRRQSYRQNIREQLLDWMSILSGQGHGRSEAVMAFVDARIKHGLVKKAVAIIKEYLAQEKGDEEIPDDDLRGWEEWVNAV